MAFLGPNDFFVLEKNSGKVFRNRGGVVSMVLDLGVNFASERGLLGIALHPQFPANPGVYLFWTCVSSTASSPFPLETRCNDANMFSADSNQILQVPLLGNRIDRFAWNANTNSLTFQQNLLMLRAYQNDGVDIPAGQGDTGQPARGNHDGGVIGFGPDGKLYVVFGDQGRRGQLQNLAAGPTPPLPDDQFGGPQPDEAHLAGVVLRLNPDGSAPSDNPFFAAGAQMGGSVGASLQRIFAYGIRNTFGMAFEPRSGLPWITEHGDDAFDEINRIFPGMNGGWIQAIGPLSRNPEYKAIETTFDPPGGDPFPSLQQWRWPPSRIADSPQDAFARLFMLPGARYSDPELSWKWATLPVGMEFVRGKELGPQFEGDLIANLVGPPTGPGYLIRMHVIAGGNRLGFDDPRLQDRVADNNAKYDLTESESLIIGTGYGIATDLKMSPNGSLYVVSHSNGAIYEIYSGKGAGTRLQAQLTGAAEVPVPGDPDGSGTASLTLNQGQGQICYQLTASNIAPATQSHIHVGAAGTPGPVVVNLNPPTNGASSGCTAVSEDLIKAIRENPQNYYVNVHNAVYPGGAIRGQLTR